ncbi:Odorant receptor 83c [Culex quinquefasciatus]|uniref:Odorant receptor n=1 Tax=Culex quinquefasciatus TaxID=7176 RepID=B0XFE5_CULQU|nr:Odorant receptor 83c [Culex quinquefasciatus]|eukprot:XP_001868367.1 Odorant receptor 83c [Culex quinquefasciatus]
MENSNRKVSANAKPTKQNKNHSSRSSLDEFIKAFDTVHKRTSFVGLDFKTTEWDINIRSVGLVLFMLTTYGLCFYTGWILREDWQSMLETLLILVLNMQGTSKLWVGFVHKVRYSKLFETTEQIYASFDADERNRSILRDMVVKLTFFLKGMTIMYEMAGGVVVIFVALFVVITLFIPYVDHTSWIGYMITFIVHSLMVVCCCNGYLASDTAFVYIVVPIIGYANSLQNEIVHFNKLLTMPKRNEKLIAEKLDRIGKLHRMVIDFELHIIEHFQVGCLAEISLQAGSVLLCIFLSYICGYVQAYSILVVVFSQIMEYCVIGTIITAKNEQITADIYNVGWHLLEKPQQKTIMFMLHRAQTARDLTIGKVASLNMITFVKIMKTTYSFFAMLVTVLE